MRRDRRRCRSCDRGSTTIEVAILLPLMMLLLMTVVQLGIWWHTRAVVTTAANKGLDTARLADGTATDGQRVTEAFLSNAAALDNRSVAVERGTDTTSVVVTGEVTSLLFGLPLHLTVSADAPTERVMP